MGNLLGKSDIGVHRFDSINSIGVWRRSFSSVVRFLSIPFVLYINLSSPLALCLLFFFSDKSLVYIREPGTDTRICCHAAAVTASSLLHLRAITSTHRSTTASQLCHTIQCNAYYRSKKNVHAPLLSASRKAYVCVCPPQSPVVSGDKK